MSAARIARLAAVGGLAAALAGCASVPADARNPRDPFEGVNRAVFGFNEAVDDAVLRPVVRGYQAVVPQLVRTGVDNFFGNIGDLWSATNHFLQGKPQSGLPMLTRVGMNSLFGIGGVLDPATEAGLERQNEDFGQTLGRWGLPAGPYLVLPFFGPSAARDAAARPLDMTANSTSRIFKSTAAADVAWGLSFINTRANLLGASKALDDVALDKYLLMRDGYLARRRNLVYDGDPPEEPEPKTGRDTPK